VKQNAVLLIACLGMMSCGGGATKSGADAAKLVADAEAELLALSNQAGQAQWIAATYITQDTEAISAALTEKAINAGVKYAKLAAQFDGVTVPPDVGRKLKLLKVGLVVAAPADPKLSAELTKITTGMESHYGRAKYCPTPDNCQDIGKVSKTIAESRDPDKLLDAWKGWHDTAKPIRSDFVKYVNLANQGARELNFKDSGAMWRSKYDMEPDAFAREVDRLWEQVKPLYVSLHAYTRNQLRKKYGDKVVPADGPIPAHLLGNMWAQSWDNLYPMLAPPNADPGYDLSKILAARKATAVDMTKMGERMYLSLGFKPLPSTFWERSMLTKPRDREVVCHASAWDVDNVDDLRIKMCIEPTGEDLFTIHHELGHSYYQRAYNQQPFLFRDSANDGFHEAIGDTVTLSMTPEYLVKIGLLDKVPPESADMGVLMKRALEKVSFLPFGLVIDQWRWKVFSGEIKPEQLNATWWELRKKYQGVAPPVARTEDDFDPGAKYHVPASVPYTRYFLAHLLQFQFHRALAEKAGCKQPLYRCSVYENKEAGQAFEQMLKQGASRPWPETLKLLTGKSEIDATAVVDYFAPLKKWLDEQNAGHPTGW
jgi:peptidyl-dipeptidase A